MFASLRTVIRVSGLTLASAAFWALLLPGTVHGQESELVLGEVRLVLGMSQAEALSSLRERYEVTANGNESWLVQDRDGSPSQTVGRVSFQDDRLASASKFWFQLEEGNNLATELFSALSNLRDEGRHVADVAISSVTPQTGLRINTIDLQFGSKHLTLRIVQDEGSLFLELINDKRQVIRSGVGDRIF